MTEKSMKDRILEKAKKGKVVFMTCDGPMESDLKEFVKQPTEGLLYDLNRDRVTVLTFIEDPKWVNDFAVGQVIGQLKQENETMQAAVEAARAAVKRAKHPGDIGLGHALFNCRVVHIEVFDTLRERLEALDE